MKTRWMVATVSAFLLATLVSGVPPVVQSEWLADAEAADSGACDPKAKPAKLDFTLKDINGQDVNLASYKGKVIVLDFWATWCGPCKIEIPGFVELQTKYKDKGLAVLGVLVEDTMEKAKRFAAQYKMNYPILNGDDRSDVQDAYGPIWGLPTTFVIGRDGKICKKHTGFATKDQFEREIKGLL